MRNVQSEIPEDEWIPVLPAHPLELMERLTLLLLLLQLVDADNVPEEEQVDVVELRGHKSKAKRGSGSRKGLSIVRAGRPFRGSTGASSSASSHSGVPGRLPSS